MTVCPFFIIPCRARLAGDLPENGIYFRRSKYPVFLVVQNSLRKDEPLQVLFEGRAAGSPYGIEFGAKPHHAGDQFGGVRNGPDDLVELLDDIGTLFLAGMVKFLVGGLVHQLLHQEVSFDGGHVFFYFCQLSFEDGFLFSLFFGAFVIGVFETVNDRGDVFLADDKALQQFLKELVHFISVPVVVAAFLPALVIIEIFSPDDITRHGFTAINAFHKDFQGNVIVLFLVRDAITGCLLVNLIDF